MGLLVSTKTMLPPLAIVPSSWASMLRPALRQSSWISETSFSTSDLGRSALSRSQHLCQSSKGQLINSLHKRQVRQVFIMSPFLGLLLVTSFNSLCTTSRSQMQQLSSLPSSHRQLLDKGIASFQDIKRHKDRVVLVSRRYMQITQPSLRIRAIERLVNI